MRSAAVIDADVGAGVCLSGPSTGAGAGALSGACCAGVAGACASASAGTSARAAVAPVMRGTKLNGGTPEVGTERPDRAHASPSGTAPPQPLGDSGGADDRRKILPPH